MFFLQTLDPEKNREWNNLINNTDFNSLWDKFENERSTINFIHCIICLIDTVKSENKAITKEFSNLIVDQLETVLHTLNVDDLQILALNYIKKFNYELDIVRFSNQKRYITYLIGENSINDRKSSLLDKTIVGTNNYNPAIVDFFKRNNTKIRYTYLGGMLSSGLFLLNVITEPNNNKLLHLGLQLIYIALVAKSSDLLIPKDISLLTNKEKYQAFETHIDILRQNLTTLDRSISQYSHLMKGDNQRVFTPN